MIQKILKADSSTLFAGAMTTGLVAWLWLMGRSAYTNEIYWLLGIIAAAGLGLVGILVVKRELILNPWLWLAIGSLLSIEMILDWYSVGNHRFVYSYLCIMLFVVLRKTGQEREDLLRTNLKWVFFAVMFLAGFQKLISPDYTDGTTCAHMICTGEFFGPIYRFFPEWKSVIDSNNLQLGFFQGKNPQTVGEIYMKSPVNNLPAWGLAFAWLIIITELAVPVVFLVIKNEAIRHWMFILFILAIFFTRMETGFHSILFMMGLGLTPAANTITRGAYMVLIVSFLALVATGIGLS